MQTKKTLGTLALVAFVSLWNVGCGSEEQRGVNNPPASSTRATSSAKPVAKASSGADSGVGDAEKGKATFTASCVACHTPDGGAKPNLGKDMIKSKFTAGLDDDALMTFIKVGRDAGDPLNTTGVGMPPKGGDPSISDQDLRNLVAFIRDRQDQEGIDYKAKSQ
ncbi:MAG: c-type cytochrome [Algisphaera sp.]